MQIYLLTPLGFDTTYGFQRQTWWLTPAVAERNMNVVFYDRLDGLV